MAALSTHSGLFGTYHPDTITSYSVIGRNHMVTANEGDARDYFWDAETEAQCNGPLPMGQYDWDEDDGCLVYDSGDLIERITADRFPEYFNTTDNELAVDDRSDNNGPKSEAITPGQLCDRILVLVGLEHMGGFMTFDITDPEAVQFVPYTNHRNYDAAVATEDGDVTDAALAQAGDLATVRHAVHTRQPEPPGVALLLVANEVSGTLSVYQEQ